MSDGSSDRPATASLSPRDGAGRRPADLSLRRCLTNTGAVLREAAREARARWLTGLLLLLPVLAGVWALHSVDHSLDAWLRLNQKEPWLALGRAASRYGELHFAPLLALALIAAVGLIRRSSALCWAALAGVLAGASGGLLVNIVKIFVGRPRPSTPIPDGIHPFHLGWDFASFPSGHATHCAAITVAVFLLAPRSGLLCLLGSALVMWSRWYLERHYPSDIWAGIWLGATLGLLFGSAAKRVLRAQSETVQTTSTSS